VYTVRAAQTAGVSAESMRAEVERTMKRSRAKSRRQQERRELNPAVTNQPEEKGIRYDNIRSAMAEEGVIRLFLYDDTIFPAEMPAREEDFSSPLLGKIFVLLWQVRGSSYPLTALSSQLTGEEMSHLTALSQKPESTANARRALADYLRIMEEEKQKRCGEADDPLAMAYRKYKEKKNTEESKHDR